MEQFFQWFFDGLGTFLIGLVIGGGSGGAICYRIISKKTSQIQKNIKAGDNARVQQSGGNIQN